MLLLGLAGALWSSVALPLFWSAAPVRSISTRILMDDHFKSGPLNDAIAGLKRELRPSVLQPDLERAAALLWVRVAEEAMQRGSAESADSDIMIAGDQLRFSISINPADSFLWLKLYSLEVAQNGFDIKNVGYLNQSYETGPREGWIALRRNRLGLAAFPLLGHPMQEKVLLEFAGMVSNGLMEDAAINLAGEGWKEKDRLLESLRDVDLNSRVALSKILARGGMGGNIRIPGVKEEERSLR
ncbi:hypothetical protein [Bradyrhizobium vignae]|uniref:hypothetical protein n=1 Tax=Bradyrhizobium vignae TaxID=1549949 RepID=UPI00100BC7C4|nr:hypothetical protein [Bradyrhizobium vignae]RXG85984.1 hypothetical protein EAV90_34405 [Bradyrhizobium vignae]